MLDKARPARAAKADAPAATTLAVRIWTHWSVERENLHLHPELLGLPSEQRKKLPLHEGRYICVVLRKEGEEIGQVLPELFDMFAGFPGVPADILPDHAFTELMALARVPADSASRRWPLISGAESLRRGVCYELNCEWVLHGHPGRVKAWQRFERTQQPRHLRHLKQLRRVRRLSSDLRATLQNLDLSVRNELAASWRGESYVDEMEKPIGTLAVRSARAVERVETMERIQRDERKAARVKRKAARRPAGRPSSGGLGFDRRNKLLRFTLHLLWDVRAAGGRLTLDKNMQKGTLPEALKLLAPCLPPGFVPDELPLSTLQRVKALDQKTREFGSPIR